MNPNFGPFTNDMPIAFTDDLPSEVDVVIIGGGVVGVFSALLARRKGLSVALVEKGRIAGEQSSRNWGWIRQQGRDEEETPIVMESKNIWKKINKELNGKAGLVEGGTTYLATSEKHMSKLEEWMETAKRHQLDTRTLSAGELGKVLDPDLSDNKRWHGGLFTPSDARAEPWVAVPLVAKLSHEEGVSIAEGCAVRALDIQTGKIKGVITEKGTIKCSQIVVAAGAWTSLFLRKHNISIPQLSVLATVARTEALPKVLEGGASDGELAFRRREDGGYSLALNDQHEFFIGKDAFRNLKTYLPILRHTLSDSLFRVAAPSNYPDAWGTARNWEADEISPFEKIRVLDPKPTKNAVSKMQSRFAARFPKLGTPKILNAWGGMIDTMPDIVPIVDRVTNFENLIVATGMSGHGFGAGPGFATIIANMLSGKAVGHDVSRFRFNRFSDGSKLIPGPHI